MFKNIWITWEKQRRNREISKHLKFLLFEIDVQKSWIIRYIRSSLKTIRILKKFEPEIVVTQNPSIILTTLTIILKGILKYKVIVDAHYLGILPFEGKYQIINFWTKILQKFTDLTLVTNNGHKEIVEKNGGNSFILPDKIPEAPNVNEYKVKGKNNVAFVCSFSNDEPYNEVFSSAEILNKSIMIYVTGNHKNALIKKNLSKNIQLLGYLTDDQFWSLLKSVDIVMDLTRRENCLVCGAYEAISARKPMIISDTNALRKYFFKGSVYVKPNPKEIADGIDFCLNNYQRILSEIECIKKIIEKDWDEKIKKLKNILENLKT